MDDPRDPQLGEFDRARRTPAASEFLQDLYAPNSVCFGCGPANPQGLRIKSRVDGDAVVADFKAAPHHLAFEGYVNGGIIGTLFDCHGNWAALYYLMRSKGLSRPPGTVTSSYSVTFRRPTPIDEVLHLSSRPVEILTDRAIVETELDAGGKMTASGQGTFVVVKEGHPAYGRWG